MTDVIDALKDGPLSYYELENRFSSNRINLDYQLKGLLCKRQVIFYPGIGDGPFRFGLPLPPPADPPQPKPRHKLSLTQIIERKRALDRARKPCPSCNTRRSVSKFTYDGKVNGVCLYCKGWASDTEG